MTEGGGAGMTEGGGAGMTEGGWESREGRGAGRPRETRPYLRLGPAPLCHARRFLSGIQSKARSTLRLGPALLCHARRFLSGIQRTAQQPRRAASHAA